MADDKIKRFVLKLRDELNALATRVDSVERIRAVSRDGRDGAPGAPGEPGERGPQGIAGEQGPQGIAGRDGRDGMPGPKGDSVTGVEVEQDNVLSVWIGGIKTLAGKIVTQRGERGLQGPKGDRGPQGPAGKDGKDGKDGTSITKVELSGRELFVWLDGVRRKAGSITLPSLGGPGGGGGVKGANFEYKAVVAVRSAVQLSGTLRSDVLYVIDGVIDFSGTGFSVTVPEGGMSIAGHSPQVSGLICSDDNFTLFRDANGGAGSVYVKGVFISVNGSGSQVYDLTTSDTDKDFLTTEVIYLNCTSRGQLDCFRQGLEDKVKLSGATPTLTLSGAWPKGFRLTTAEASELDNAMNAPLYAAGAGFAMTGRFITDISADLGDTASLADFSPSNFVNPSSFQIITAFVTRNGVLNSEDATVVPNFTAAHLEAFWRDNVGVGNTFLGGRSEITSQTVTTISVSGTFYDIAGTYATNALEHFDSPAPGELRHIGDDPRNFAVTASFDFLGDAGDQIRVKVVKWDDSAGMFIDLGQKTRDVLGSTGGGDVAFFDFTVLATLDRNDFVKAQVANLTDTSNVTALVESNLFVSER